MINCELYGGQTSFIRNISRISLLRPLYGGFLIRGVRKITKSNYWLRYVCPSVNLSAWNNLASIKNFRKILHLNIFRKFVEKIQYRHILTGITGTLHEDQKTFLIATPTLLLIMRNVSDEPCRENQITHFALNNFFPPRK